MRTRTRWIGGLGSLALVVGGVVACLHAAAHNESSIYVDQARLRVERQKARDALARWDSAVTAADPGRFVPTGEAIQQVGTWEPTLADRAMRALAAGNIGFGKLSDDVEAAGPPRRGEVRWADGRTRTVNLISPQEARDRMVDVGHARSFCPKCQPLLLSNAHLVTGHVQTTGGPATAPMWEFSITLSAKVAGQPPAKDGDLRSKVKLRRLAVATPDGLAVGAPRDPDHPGAMSFYGAWPDRSSLTVYLGGGRIGDCPTVYYTGEAYESPHAVTVVIVPHERCVRDPYIEGPPEDLRVTVHLASPLGVRAVVETEQGRPVPTATG